MPNNQHLKRQQQLSKRLKEKEFQVPTLSLHLQLGLLQQ